MSKSFGDLNKLIDFARQQGVSVIIDYSEVSDEMSVEIISAAGRDCYYEKRIIDVDYFIKGWHERLSDEKGNDNR